MLVSAKEMLEKAKAGHYAVGQFNINNLEWTKSILLTAEELKSPVILGVSEGAGKYSCWRGSFLLAPRRGHVPTVVRQSLRLMRFFFILIVCKPNADVRIRVR